MKREVRARIYNPDSAGIRIENTLLRLDTGTDELYGTGELIARSRPDLPDGLEPEVCCVIRDRKGRVLHMCESTHYGRFLNTGRYGFTVFQIHIAGYSQFCSGCRGLEVELFVIMKERARMAGTCTCCRKHGCMHRDCLS
ncbi:MAG: hypothetical protein SO101_06375 [Lachnospiraceae bacterium]|nr:hypothetical protein [Lachnospiraceae bacterium]